MIRIRVDVTQADIKQGKRGHSIKCPVALATNRALEAAAGKKGFKCQAAATDINIIDTKPLDNYRTNDLGYSHWLPISVGRFMCTYDNGKKVKPFSFILKLD